MITKFLNSLNQQEQKNKTHPDINYQHYKDLFGTEISKTIGQASGHGKEDKDIYVNIDRENSS